MFRRLLAVVLSAVLTAALWIKPAAAAETDALKESLVFDADYTTGALDDVTENFVFDRDVSTYNFEMVEGVDSVVLDTQGESLKYTAFGGSEISLGDTATYEVYFYSNDDENCHTFMSIDFDDGGIKFEYDQNTGFGFYDDDNVVVQNNGDASQYLGKWTHLVATVDSGTVKVYLNSTEIFSGEFNGSLGVTRIDAGDNWEAVYNVGFARVYDNAATPEEVNALFEACPVKTVTEDPTASAESPTTSAGSSTAAPTKAPEEPAPPTFDAGILSLAAVALSSVVAVKKRKNA